MKANTLTLMVSEIFGPTVQGEGPSLGRQATFLRLGVCNLHCTWCDTPYTWDSTRYDLSQEMRMIPAMEVIAQIRATNTRRLVITGGEPLLQQRKPAFGALARVLHAEGWHIEVETNGTKAPDTQVDVAVAQYNVSPKLAHGGDTESARIVLPALKALAATGKAIFKFVCRTPEDLDQVDRLAARAGLPRSSVWIMPEGTTSRQINSGLHALADPAVRRGYNLTTRLHVLAWGDERGR